ncbi:uncharacterized protein LOC119667330 [Teleopsis dalmanni]|uniref:uncharacterized protein LOC119665878 n=1 Tax=Teleopsis dalmanni TaxID=139649 RepID=UPI0018CF824A|nr:uncharacterized protein LOC119665878 [Teleopsis dalmanni]XP_037932547.1 uncharacterized protein LOC119667330 [Teleopsis dalmanni]
MSLQRTPPRIRSKSVSDDKNFEVIKTKFDKNTKIGSQTPLTEPFTPTTVVYQTLPTTINKFISAKQNLITATSPSTIRTMSAVSQKTYESTDLSVERNNIAANEEKSAGALIQTDIDRYIKVVNKKRKLSPQKLNSQLNKPKKSNNLTIPETQNRFSLLNNDEETPNAGTSEAKKSPKPPPIYLREKNSNSLVSLLVCAIGKTQQQLLNSIVSK